MLISDWSSDVCSSDLAIVDPDLVERDREEARAKGAVDNDPAVAVGHVGALGLGKLREHPGEIIGAAPASARHGDARLDAHFILVKQDRKSTRLHSSH